jgi:hypothetical protein
VPAGTYFVLTDAFQSGAQGSYTLQADLAPVAGGNTAGDTCADAQLLTPGTPVDGNTFQARDDIRSPCASATEGYDVVYRLNVTARSRVKLWFDSSDLREQGTITVARACEGAPLTEATAGWKGMVQLEAGWALQAMQSFAAAGALNQDDPFYPAQQAAALERLDEPDKADRMLRRVLEDLDDTHPARARIQCQRAYLWRRMRNPDAGALAAEACAAGVDNCCPQRWGR